MPAELGIEPAPAEETPCLRRGVRDAAHGVESSDLEIRKQIAGP